MNTSYSALPRLATNGQFIRDFLAAGEPCCALGVVEEGNRQTGLLALRPGDIIPSPISAPGVAFGHELLGTSRFEVVHFVFGFYGFKTYHVLINPNSLLARTVLPMMVSSGGYFIFLLNPDSTVTAFRSEIGKDTLAGLQANLSRIRRSQTTEAEYRKAVAAFKKNPEPPGAMLHWVCRDDANYLDLTLDRLELNPS